jgi:anti-sigma regulatory factor (Ser/Thr protein kinase)
LAKENRHLKLEIMILEKQTQSLIHEVNSTQATIGMSLDLDSAQVLMQMLSKNLYSDAIGSTIRECASNALDSHRRAGVDTPIIVKLTKVSNNYEFSVEDFGTGLDADDVENIISKYGKSTKRNSTTELGMMGLGFKAPLAYASSFYFTARKNGVERKYMMYEGEDVNSIDLLHEGPTDKSNGIKITIPVKWSDSYDFKTKIKEQLAYFESVYFDVDDMNNQFTIFRSEHYQKSELCPDHNLHVCLDNVYYPLDFDKLGIKRIDVRLGLKFSLTDGIFPTPNREALRYTQEAKQIILAKIATVANVFMAKYNETIVDTDDVRTAIEYFSSSARYIKNHNGDDMEVTEILKHATIPMRKPTLIGCTYFTAESLFKVKDYMMFEYEAKYELNSYRSRLSETRGHWDKQVNISRNRSSAQLAIFTGVFGDRKRRYIKEIWKGKSVKFVKKVTDFTLFSKDKAKRNTILGSPDMSSYFDLLKLYNYPKTQWRAIITEFQSCVNKIVEEFIDLDAIEIPEAWIAADKAKNYKPKPKASKNGGVKEKGDVNCKIAETPERYTGSNAKFTPIILSGKTLHTRKSLTVYGKESDRPVLDYLFGMFKNHVNLVIMSDREIKVLEMYNLHNFMSLETFLKGDNKPFRRIATARLIKKMMSVYDATFSAKPGMRDILPDLMYDVDRLVKFKRIYYHDYVVSHKCEAFDIDKFASDNNKYDVEMYPMLLKVDKLVTKFPFIETIGYHMKTYSGVTVDPMISVLKDMCRYKKARMAKGNYRFTIKVNQELVNILTDAA